jgi:hypothetical protein
MPAVLSLQKRTQAFVLMNGEVARLTESSQRCAEPSERSIAPFRISNPFAAPIRGMT